MAHFVYAIVTPNDVADRIQTDWPELDRFAAGDLHSIFPIERDKIAQRLNDADALEQSTEAFIYLSDKFKVELRELSKHGSICYMETDYFGGEGGQGACVYKNGDELMAPTWAESDTINDALQTIGVVPVGNEDAFDTIGLGAVRKNANFYERQIDG